MTATTWLTLIAAVGGPAGVVALVMVIPQVRKLQADTSKVERDAELADIDGASRLSEAALNQMNAALARADHAEARAARAEAAIGELRIAVEGVTRSLYEYRQVAQEHVAWDFQIVTLLKQAGVAAKDIPTPPPLIPPSNPGERR